MRFLYGDAVIRCAVLAIVISQAPAALALQKPPADILESFHDGCCLDPSIPRPRHFSHVTVPEARLRKALNCATNNDFVGGTRALAKALGDRTALHVAYHYGNYMAHHWGNYWGDDSSLTIAVYSADGQHGVLFDVERDRERYHVTNLPALLFKRKQWRVGVIFGGFWSYTRLWHLAQEIASRPRVTIPIADIRHSEPASCNVFDVDQTAWEPDD